MTSARKRRSGFAKVLAFGAAAALGAAACGSSGSSGASSSTTSSGSSSATMKTGPGVDAATKTITIGDITALSGIASVIGKPLDAGYKAYFDSVNAKGGIDGWKVSFNTLDDAYTPQTHVQDYNQMSNSVAFIGTSFGSPTTSAIESQAESAGVMLATVAQDSAFVNHKINLVIGTPYAVDVANGLYYLIKTKGVSNPKVAIFYQNDAYGGDGLKGFEAAKSAYGFQDVGHATYNVTDTSFTAQATQLKNSGAQYVVVTAIPTAAATLIGTAAALGYHPQWILQGPAWSEFLMTSTGTSAGKPTAVEQAMVGAWVLGFEAAWGDTSVPGMNDFLAVQKQSSPTQIPDGYYMYGYCQAQVQAAILKKAIENHDLTRAGILNAKENLGSFSWGGLIPDANYTSSNGPASRQTDIAQVDLNSPGFLKIVSNGFIESSAAKSMTFSG
ncbi:MAG TPA: ABC transporter substrate-binding protein [Acidimicrobiales bacterium]|nr:ABC transporter substrate-binding protein [Acidimicrobiales bacterium]